MMSRQTRSARPSSHAIVALSAVSLLLLAGCTRSPESRLAGTWESDVDAMVELAKKTAEEEGKDVPPLEMLKTFAPKITLAFNSDGSFSRKATVKLLGQEQVDEGSGTWKVTGSEGDTMTVEGAVTGKDDDEGTIEVSVRGANQLGDHVTGTVTISLPN